MKYIRTKDGIYEIIKIEYNEDIDMNQYFYKNGHINSHEVINQANTIEELCDEKVGTFEDGSKPYIYKKTSWVDLKKDWTQYHDNLYGAIWYDFGLKYIARMNNDGVLELL